jgi:hypothetical protein
MVCHEIARLYPMRAQIEVISKTATLFTRAYLNDQSVCVKTLYENREPLR